jgi:iron complex outermembrane receptor protein
VAEHSRIFHIFLAGIPLLPVDVMAAEARIEDLLKLDLEQLVNVPVSVASHFVESQLSSGSTVSVVTEAEWEKRGARRLHDAIANLPSTLVYPNWFASEEIMVRGYASQNNSDGIATRWDDIPIDPLEGSAQFLRNNINLGVLDRIEMIRGPGSALYGESAFHGVLAMRAFESKTDKTWVDAEFASNSYYQAAFKHSRGLGESGIRLNLAGGANGQGNQHLRYDYVDPPGYPPGSSERPFEYHSESAVFKLNSDPSRDVAWRAGVYLDRNDPQGFLGSGTSGSGGLRDRDTSDTLSNFAMAMAAATYRVGADTSAEILGYAWTQDRTYDRHLTLTRDFHGTGGEDNWGLRATLKQQHLFGNTDWSLEAALRHAKMQDTFRKISQGTTVIVDDTLAFSQFARDVHSLSLDANTTLGDGTFQLRYGGRLDDYSDFGTHVSPRLGLIYHPDSSSAIKLLYGNAFRAPTALEVKGAAAIQGNPNIKPETIDTYELAYVRQTEKTIAKLTLFKSNWNDAIVIGPAANSAYTGGQYINSGNSSAHGAEASFTYDAEPWTLQLNGSYNRSRNDTLAQDYVAFPKWIFNAGVGYHFPSQGIDVFFNNRVMTGMREGQIAASLPDPGPLKDYWRADLNVTKHYGRQLQLALDVRNLFDRKNALPSLQPNPSPGGIPEEDRSVKLALRYTF